MGRQMTGTLYGIFTLDNLGHLFLFAVQTALLLDGFRRQPDPSWLRSRSGVSAVGFAAAYGVIVEGIQFVFLPYRHFEVLDLVADFSGCLLGWMLYRILFSGFTE